MAPPLIDVVGPTASGKSALALELAEKLNGEIICADSRTVYKGMDIGTAKPSPEDQSEIPHHLLDIIKPDQSFNVANFKHLANKAISDISNGGKLPIMVGGTGLYIDSVLFDYDFKSPTTERDPLNPRHLKTTGESPFKKELRKNTLVIGLSVEKEVLVTRITQRVDDMVKNGFIDEIKKLVKNYSWDSPGLLAPGYKAFRSYIEGGQTLEEAKQQFVLNDLHLAKRQRTWFKRNPHIHWFTDATSALAFAANWPIEKSKNGQNAIISTEL